MNKVLASTWLGLGMIKNIYVMSLRIGIEVTSEVENWIGRKVTGSIPDEVIFLNLPNPSGCPGPCGLLGL
jgi:hypothetical protein